MAKYVNKQHSFMKITFKDVSKHVTQLERNQVRKETLRRAKLWESEAALSAWSEIEQQQMKEMVTGRCYSDDRSK